MKCHVRVVRHTLLETPASTSVPVERFVDHGDYSSGGYPDLEEAPDYKSSPSSGAPFWFTEDTFAVIDRNNCHTISLYRMKQKVKSNGRGVKTSVYFWGLQVKLESSLYVFYCLH
jgi:hypothetical protein